MSRLSAVFVIAFIALPAFAGEQIVVVERPVGETTVDLGAKGDSVGDLLVFANKVYDSANKFMDSGDSLMVVTGGSGKYAGAKGSMKLHPRDATPTGYDFTYDLL
jgi:allene oxide cyclase